MVAVATHCDVLHYTFDRVFVKKRTVKKGNTKPSHIL